MNIRMDQITDLNKTRVSLNIKDNEVGKQCMTSFRYEKIHKTGVTICINIQFKETLPSKTEQTEAMKSSQSCSSVNADTWLEENMWVLPRCLRRETQSNQSAIVTTTLRSQTDHRSQRRKQLRQYQRTEYNL